MQIGAITRTTANKIDFSKGDENNIAPDEDVMDVSKKLLAQNQEAYEVLAK